MMDYENEEEFIKLADELDSEEYTEKFDGDPFLLRTVISNLRGMEYHDFKNDRFAMPKLQMISDFEKLGRPDVVERIKNGDFDQ